MRGKQGKATRDAEAGDGSLVVHYLIAAGQTWIMSTPCPEGDMDWDCDVDFKDFARMAANWLEHNTPKYLFTKGNFASIRGLCSVWYRPWTLIEYNVIIAR